MTNAARWVALLPVAIVAVAVPFVLAARDPAGGARQRLAAMTPAQRKAVEQNREAYDGLGSLDQYELRKLNDELLKLDPKERAELEATMGRLQAWVATFPDAVRKKYDAAAPSERIEILKSQLKASREDKGRIVAEVRRAEEEHRRAMEGAPPRQKDRKLPPDLRKIVMRAGNPDDRALFALLQRPGGLTPKDRGIVLWALATGMEAKGLGAPPGREAAVTELPAALLRKFSFIPAFKQLSKTPTDGEKRAAARVVGSIYLLTPPDNPMTQAEVFRSLELEPMMFGGFAQHPTYLWQQLALVKDYADKRKPIPSTDQPRVKAILGKLP